MSEQCFQQYVEGSVCLNENYSSEECFWTDINLKEKNTKDLQGVHLCHNNFPIKLINLY